MLLPLWYVVFLLAITCHEAAHALAAYLGGDETAYLGGQVTLNPLPHVMREPIGTVLVPLLSFTQLGWMMGWASAPYDPLWADRHPRRAGLMAAAGPAANLLLALIALIVLKVGLSAGIWAPSVTEFYELDRLVDTNPGYDRIWDGVGRFCSVMLSLNYLLMWFNLLPVPPMDGAAVLTGLVAPLREPMERFRAVPFSGLIGILLAWWLFGKIFWPLYLPLLGWLYG
jgi:Zn-dependent protease